MTVRERQLLNVQCTCDIKMLNKESSFVIQGPGATQSDPKTVVIKNNIFR